MLANAPESITEPYWEVILHHKSMLKRITFAENFFSSDTKSHSIRYDRAPRSPTAKLGGQGICVQTPVRTAQASIHGVVESLGHRFDQCTDAAEIIDISLLYLAWSARSVSNCLGNQLLGLLEDTQRAIERKQTIRAVVELTPLVKQIPIVMPVILDLPQWLVKVFPPDLGRILALRKVWKESQSIPGSE